MTANRCDGKVTALAIPPEREKYFDSDSVSCLANLANMTSEEKDEIYRLRESLKADISSASNIKKFNKNARYRTTSSIYPV